MNQAEAKDVSMARYNIVMSSIKKIVIWITSFNSNVQFLIQKAFN